MTPYYMPNDIILCCVAPYFSFVSYCDVLNICVYIYMYVCVYNMYTYIYILPSVCLIYIILKIYVCRNMVASIELRNWSPGRTWSFAACSVAYSIMGWQTESHQAAWSIYLISPSPFRVCLHVFSRHCGHGSEIAHPATPNFMRMRMAGVCSAMPCADYWFVTACTLRREFVMSPCTCCKPRKRARFF